jgi:hypothetical protein
MVGTKEFETIHRHLRIPDNVRFCTNLATVQHAVITKTEPAVRVISVEPVILLTPRTTSVARFLQALHVADLANLSILTLEIA